MSKRSIGSANISFGLVSIPVKIYTTASSNGVSFNMINPKTKNRLKQKMVDAVTGEEVDRKTALNGYEYSKNNFVIFTDDELNSLNTINKNTIDVQGFTKADNISQFQIEKYNYLSPDKGGAKAYKLFSEALKKTNKVAIGTWAVRSKEHLVMVFPYTDGLVIAQLYYSSEVRTFESDCPNISISDEELDMGIRLINQMSNDNFDISKFENKFVNNVQALAEKKAAGENIVTNTDLPKTDVTDLFAQLKASLQQKDKKPKASKKKVSKKKAS